MGRNIDKVKEYINVNKFLKNTYIFKALRAGIEIDPDCVKAFNASVSNRLVNTNSKVACTLSDFQANNFSLD